MPRWERKTDKKEQYWELLLDGARVYSAEGYRYPGDEKWLSDSPVEWSLDDEGAARAGYEKRQAKIPKAATLVGEAVPEIGPFRDGLLRQREEMRAARAAWEAKHGQMAVLQAQGTVRWVGLKDANAAEFYEFTLAGTTFTSRTGKTKGGRAKTETITRKTREEVLVSAQITMMSVLNNLGFGPPPKP